MKILSIDECFQPPKCIYVLLTHYIRTVSENNIGAPRKQNNFGADKLSNFQSCDRIIGLFSIGLNLQSFLSPINSLVLFDFSLYCYRSPTYRYRNIGKSNSFLMYQKYFHLWCTPTEYVLKANGMKNVSSSTS